MLQVLQSALEHELQTGARVGGGQLGLNGRQARRLENGREAVRVGDRKCDGEGENGAQNSAHGPIQDEIAFRPCFTQVSG